MWEQNFAGTATFHDGCHGLRELGVEREPRELLKHVQGLTLIEGMKEAKTCCGFGGGLLSQIPDDLDRHKGEGQMRLH